MALYFQFSTSRNDKNICLDSGVCVYAVLPSCVHTCVWPLEVARGLYSSLLPTVWTHVAAALSHFTATTSTLNRFCIGFSIWLDRKQMYLLVTAGLLCCQGSSADVLPKFVYIWNSQGLPGHLQSWGNVAIFKHVKSPLESFKHYSQQLFHVCHSWKGLTETLTLLCIISLCTFAIHNLL